MEKGLNLQSYDCSSMEKGLKEGNNRCPITKQVLTATDLTPTDLMRDFISSWCKEHEKWLLDPEEDSEEEAASQPGEKEAAEARERLNLLLEKMSSPSTQKEAAREIRMLTRDVSSVGALFGESKDTLPKLLNPVLEWRRGVDLDHYLQQDLVKILMDISTLADSKKLLVHNPAAIQLLVQSLYSENMETRCFAAKALFGFPSLDYNKWIIENSGDASSNRLSDFIEEGYSTMNYVVSALVSVSSRVIEKRGRALDAGAVREIIKKMEFEFELEEFERESEGLLAILEDLSSLETVQKKMFDQIAEYLLLVVLTKEHFIAAVCRLLSAAKKNGFECRIKQLWATLEKLSSHESAQKKIFDLHALLLLLVISTKEFVFAIQNGEKASDTLSQLQTRLGHCQKQFAHASALFHQCKP